MQLIHLAEVITVDAESDRQGEFIRAVEQGPEEQPPVFLPLIALDPDFKDRTEQSGHFLPLQSDCVPVGLIFFEEGSHPFVKPFGGVD